MSYTSAQLIAAYTAANVGVPPSAATAALLAAFATETQTGQLSDAAALSFVLNSADSTTAVAEQSYNFFTGKTPTKAGLDFLVNSPTNTTDLNDPFYQAFSLENRYINFAGNLGVVGEGSAAFLATYGGISLTADPATGISNFVNVIYETIIGSAYAVAAGINPTAAKVDITSRLANFIQIAKDRGLITAASTPAQVDIAVKAELVGYMMAEGIKADVGVYAAGSNNFVNALVNGNAQYNVDMVGTYSALGGGTGSAVGGQGPTPGGSTLALTAGIDALNGTVGNDTFIGDTPTVTAADSLNGGAGSDTFRYFGNTTAALPQLVSVENVNLVNSAADINLSAATGVSFVSLEGNPTASRNITVGAGMTVGLTNITDGAAETFTGTATQGAMTAILAGGINVGTLNLDGAGITGVTIQSNGTANKIATLASTGTEASVTVSGGAALTITNALAASVTKLDASASAGVTAIFGASATATVTGGAGVDTVDVSAVAGKLTVAMGAGNDVLTLGAAVAPAGSSVDGGDGTDVLSVSQAGGSAFGNFTAGNTAGFVNFETLRLTATGAGTATFDATTLPVGVTLFQVGTSAAGISMSNVAANPAITFVGSIAGATGLTVGLKDATGSTDAINVTFLGSTTAGGRSTAALSAPGVETINIVSSVAGGSSQNAVNKLTADASLTKVNISGAGAFTLVTDNMTKTLTIDGSTATGSLNIDASATVTAGIGINVNGGLANDTIKAGQGAVLVTAPNQLIFGGGGGDAIDLVAAHVPIDTLVYKSAGDSLYDLTGVAGASATVAPNSGKMDAVSNFLTAHDKVDLTAFALTNAQAVVADKGLVATGAELNALVASATFFQDASATLRGVSEAHLGADTYLFVDVNHDGVFTAGADLAIKFVGISSVVSADLLH